MKKNATIVYCNICSEKIKSNKFGYIEDYLNIEKRWGYGSEFDNEVHLVNICQSCYRELVKSLKIKPIIHN